MAKIYQHVFAAHRAGGQWFHHFSADTIEDAVDEMRSLADEGYRAKRVSSDRDPLVILAELRAGGGLIMAIEVDTVTGPAAWACALINGDTSSFSLDDDGGEAELAAMAAWQDGLAADGWYVVSIVDDSERFTWSYAVHGGTAQGGDVVDYVVHRDKREG